MRMTKGAGSAKQAGLSVGARPLHWVVLEWACGVERVGIRSGLRAGKERESGPTKLRTGILDQKSWGNRKSLFIF
jgi:hypothetical protein